MLGLFALPALAWWPLVFIFAAVIAVGTLIGWRHDKREAERRRGESICNFARSFDCRVIDPWVVRAVYEEFSESYPIRAEDSFRDDLRTDEEDLEDSIEAIAQRIGRSLDNTEANLVWGRVENVTVGDLVLFLNAQPKLGAYRARGLSLSQRTAKLFP